MSQLQVTTKLKAVLAKIQQVAGRAEEDMFVADRKKVARALVAIGLCRQAREQVNAACQNLGFPINSLNGIPEAGECNLESWQKAQSQLAEARQDVARLVSEKFGVANESVEMSIAGFADECSALAALMVARAEQYLQAA